MELPGTEPDLQDSIKQIMRTLPPPLRSYLSHGTYSMVAKRLIGKYQLHIDKGVVLEREIMLLLLGIENPDEFRISLETEATIPTDTVLSIMTDLNQEVFIPLQIQIRTESDRVTKPETPSKGSESSISVPSPTAQPTPSMRIQPTARPAISPTKIPTQVSSSPLPPKTILPAVDTGKSMNVSLATIQKIVPLPANLPGMMLPDAVVPSINRLAGRTMPIPTQPTPPSRPQSLSSEPKPPVRSYSVDPYREEPDKQ